MLEEKTTKMMRQNNFITASPLMLLMILAWSGEARTTNKSPLEVSCELKDEYLRNCKIYCPDGRLWLNGCPVCACKSELCRDACPPNLRCVVFRDVSRDVPSDFYRCIDADYQSPPPPTPFVFPVNEFSTTTTSSTTPDIPTTTTSTVQDETGTCHFAGRCDASGGCPVPNAVCRFTDGICCRIPNIETGVVPSNGPRCLETPSVGHCRALGIQYVYNVTTAKCVSMSFGGCVASANSFPTMEDCQTVCEQPCQKPKAPGRCRASIPRYYYNPDTEICEQFDFGGCEGNGNNFVTRGDCEAYCKPRYHNTNHPDPILRDLEQDDVTTQPPPPTTEAVTTQRPQVDDNFDTGRDGFVQEIMGSFVRLPNVESRSNTQDNNQGNDGDPIAIIRFRPRPNPENDNGDSYTVNNPQTTTPPYVFNGMNGNANNNEITDNNNNNGNNMDDNNNNDNVNNNNDDGNYLLRIANRYQTNNRPPQMGQVTYDRLRSRPDIPPVRNRGYMPSSHPGTQRNPTSYQSSVDAIRRYLQQG